MTTATEQARSWLGDFGDALERGDAGGVAALFHAESYWRDLVAFTWNITTTEGPDDIAAMIEATGAAATGCDRRGCDRRGCDRRGCGRHRCPARR